jgi:hypothetical protein
MSAPPGARACLTEDELLALATGALADDGAAETHLASCALCVALMAAAARATPLRAWDALVGATLGPYRLDAQLGAGGLGAVYRAWDPRLARAIAVKVLHDAGDDGRLVAEARAAAAIEHRAIVRIYDVGVTDGLAFVAMELVDGETVRSVLAGGALPPARVRELLATLIDGVAAAHARGVVHRDLKPENLILTRDGLRILDFGLARFVDGDAVDTTGPGGGTAGYMAPEQIRGGSVDARADLFAIGAIAYELATGRRAFPGPTAADRLTATLRDRPPVDGLGELAPIVLRCLAVEVDERFQTALDLAWALRTSVVRPAVAAPPRWSRRAIVLGGLSTLAAGIGGVVVGRRRITRPPPPPELRALTHRSGRVYAARFTHDGSRVVVCAAWDAEPLELSMLELSTGVAGTLDLTGAHLAALSARGELALTRGHRFVDHQSARGELVVRSLHGGEPRVVAADVQDAEFLPEPLTPASPAPGADPSPIRDGALAVVRPSPRGFRIELPIDTPLVDEPGWITHLRASPDGTHLAYLRHPGTNDDSGALVLLELATRTTRVVGRLVQHRWPGVGSQRRSAVVHGGARRPRRDDPAGRPARPGGRRPRPDRGAGPPPRRRGRPPDAGQRRRVAAAGDGRRRRSLGLGDLVRRRSVGRRPHGRDRRSRSPRSRRRHLPGAVSRRSAPAARARVPDRDLSVGAAGRRQLRSREEPGGVRDHRWQRPSPRGARPDHGRALARRGVPDRAVRRPALAHRLRSRDRRWWPRPAGRWRSIRRGAAAPSSILPAHDLRVVDLASRRRSECHGHAAWRARRGVRLAGHARRGRSCARRRSPIVLERVDPISGARAPCTGSSSRRASG